MVEPLRVDAGELSADEILTALNEGRRVVVTTTMMGGDHRVTLRHDGTTYYCDTPTTLHKHPTEEEMLTCIDRMGYARDEQPAE
jgi:hemin uptake protein HemP